MDTVSSKPPKQRLPFGIYAIVFFLALHIIALLLEAARVQFGFAIDLLTSGTNIVLGEFGFGGRLMQIPELGGNVLVFSNLVLVVLYSVLIAGLLARMRWVWVATMFLIGSSLMISILDYFNEAPRYINMLIGVLVVFYLNERSVRHVYEQEIEGEGRTI